MKKFLIFLLLLLPAFFLPIIVKAEAGKCICEPEYVTESKCEGEPCCDTSKRFCETECGGGCTSWEKTRNRWQECDPPDEEGNVDCHCESKTICSISYNREYQCTKNCDGRLQERIHETGCGNSYTSWVDTREGFEWQKCDSNVPGFYCSGECIEAPENLQEYQTPDSSKIADSPAKLPVKLDWSDVPGFWAGWSGGGGGSAIQKYAACQSEYVDPCWEVVDAAFEVYKETHPDAYFCMGEWMDEWSACLRSETEEHCQNLLEEEECEEKCPPEKECYKPDEFVQSYKITITGTGTGDLRSCDDVSDIDSYTAVLGTSEFFAPCPCFFKSNRIYNWTVWACCNEDGTNCGPPSVKQFKTSSAPEPKIPYDPDWAGSGGAVNVPLNLTLEWCESDFKYDWANGPKSYRLLFYETRKGEDVCHPLLKRGEGCIPDLVVPEIGLPEPPASEFPNEEKGIFTKDTSYAWEVAACKDTGMDCTDYSQRWRFQITGTLGTVSLIYPPNDPSGENPVGIPIVFRWAGSLGAASFYYEVYDSGGKKIATGTTPSPSFTLDMPPLQLTKKYSWRVKPCWDLIGKDCENVWAESFFWTTGRPPKPESMKPEGADIPIPITFEWEKVPGAKSFVFKIQGDGLDLEEAIIEPGLSLNYPDLHQEKNYSWQVKTCARGKEEDCVKDQSCCGTWSVSKNLTTFKLSTPSNPLSPEENKEVFTYEMPEIFSWTPTAYTRYYKYTINYVVKSPEEVNDCPPGTVAEKIIINNSDNVSLSCLGDYQWQVQACLDKDCQETGDWSPLWSFTLSQKEVPGGVGIVPCGRTYDNPKTAWNEREACQIKHLFLILKIILDFLLLRLGIIILILLIVLSGILFYISMGAPETISQIKLIWNAAGIGYGIILFAWIIVSLFLAIVGFKLGPWWQIKF